MRILYFLTIDSKTALSGRNNSSQVVSPSSDLVSACLPKANGLSKLVDLQ